MEHVLANDCFRAVGQTFALSGCILELVHSSVFMFGDCVHRYFDIFADFASLTAMGILCAMTYKTDGDPDERARHGLAVNALFMSQVCCPILIRACLRL